MNGQRSWDSEVCIVSASSRGTMIERTEMLAQYLSTDPAVTLKDIAFTLNTRLDDTDGFRLAIVATSLPGLATQLAAALQRLSDPQCTRIKDPNGVYYFQEPLGACSRLAFLFPGEGAQYPHMLSDLCIHFPEVRAWFDLIDRAFLDHPRGYLPSQIIFPIESDGDPNQLWQMDVAVEAVFTANQALCALLNQLAIRPDVIVGHSSGEYSALLASHVLHVANDEQLIQHIRDLNSIYEQLAAHNELPEAVLLAVGVADRALIAKIVEQSAEPLYAAIDNCPHQVVLCGAPAAARRAAEHLQRAGAVCEELPFRRPYHTPLFENFKEPLRDFFRRLEIGRPAVELYSCATAAPYPSEPDAIRELAVEQWTRPVRFRETIDALYAAGVQLFVEVGPRGNLTTFVEDTLRGRPHLAVASNLPHRSGIRQLNHLLALLAAQHVPLRLDYLYERRSPQTAAFEVEAPAARAEQQPSGMPLSLRLPSLRLATNESPPHSEPRPEQAHLLPPPTPHPSAADRQSTTRAQVMDEYLKTMDRFLRTQQDVMQAFLGGAVPQGDRVEDRPSVAVMTSTNGAAPAAVVSDNGRARSLPVERLPFIRQIMAHTPGRTLSAVCVVDLDEDVFLLEHTLAGRIAMTDEGLIGLPVMPLTVSMEILAEAAFMLQPQRVVVGMRNVRAYRWLTVEDDRLTLHITAQALADDEVAVQLREADVNDPSRARPGLPVIEAIVILSDAYPSAETPPPFEPRAARESKWRPGAMYENTGMFHGPLFQWVDRMEHTGADGALATFKARPSSTFFRSNTQPTFLIDPALLDAMGQVVGYWVGDQFQHGLSVFPFRLERLEVYGPPLAAGEACHCLVRVRFVDDEWVRSDIDVIRPDGALHARMLQWEDRRLDLPRRLYDFRIAPHDVLLSDVWSAPLPQQIKACRITYWPADVLEAHGAIWLRVLTYMILNRRERQTWRHLHAAPRKRQLDWLMGRIAAKDAVRAVLQAQLGLVLCPADIEITSDAHGRPEVNGSWLQLVDNRPIVSIAHSGDVAMALASASNAVRGLGIDLELADRVSVEIERAACTASEQQLLNQLSRPEWSTRFWCAKEAVGKAVGRGMIDDPREFEIQAVDRSSGALTVQPPREAVSVLLDWADTTVVAQTVREDDWIVAVAAL